MKDLEWHIRNGNLVKMPSIVITSREESHSLPNNILHTLSVESIPTFDCCLNASSSDHIGQFNAKAKAKYGISLGCGAKDLASSANMLNCSKDIKSISDFKNLNTTPTSSGDSLVFSTISSRFLPSSKNRNSGDTNSNLPINLFTKKIIRTSPFESREDMILFASTTNNNHNHFNGFINLSDKALSTLSDSSLTSVLVSLDFDTIDFTSSNFANSFLTSLLTTNDHSVPETFFNSSSSSSGIGITTSAIAINSLDGYRNLNSFVNCSDVGFDFVDNDFPLALDGEFDKIWIR